MKFKNTAIILIALSIACFFIFRTKSAAPLSTTHQEITPYFGNIEEVISTTGTIEPQNRLAIIPPIGGRIEKILVKEGDLVKAGETLALMSSTDRAALLDAAIPQGKEKVKYWEEVYKATPLISPIQGKVIVRAVEPGQTVGSGTAVLVLADKLIVKGKVDETDIGQIHTGQVVTITLDAYPDIKTLGKVGHISYESTVVNNVTIYEVAIIPDNVPAIYRSGMSANLDIIKTSKRNILLLQEEAVQYKDNQAFVLIKDHSEAGYRSVKIATGLSQNGAIEIISGLTSSNTIIILDPNTLAQKKAKRTSFFQRPGTRKR